MAAISVGVALPIFVIAKILICRNLLVFIVVRILCTLHDSADPVQEIYERKYEIYKLEFGRFPTRRNFEKYINFGNCIFIRSYFSSDHYTYTCIGPLHHYTVTRSRRHAQPSVTHGNWRRQGNVVSVWYPWVTEG